jgi:predicted nucleic acid-binding protein
VLRPGQLGQTFAPRVAALVTAGVAATTDVVVTELLRGARNDVDYARLQARLSVLPLLPVTPERWVEAARLGYLLLRRHGLTVATPDLVIAAVAIANSATLVHRDSDFDLVARHAALVVESHI